MSSETFDLKFINEDHQTLKEIRNDPDIMKNLSEVYSIPESMPTSLTLGVEQNNQFIGAVVLKNIRWINRKTEIMIYLGKQYRSKGIGKKVLEKAVDYIFNRLNFHRIEAEVYEYNKVALQLFHKSGFIKEGVLRDARFMGGQYHDIIRFGLLKDEYRGNNL